MSVSFTAGKSLDALVRREIKWRFPCKICRNFLAQCVSDMLLWFVLLEMNTQQPKADSGGGGGGVGKGQLSPART